MLHHLPHTGTRCFFFLPIYRPIFAPHLCKFSGQVDQFIIPIKILDVLRLGQSIVKCQLFVVQIERFVGFFAVGDLVGDFQQLLNYLLVGQQPFEVIAHGTGQNLGEFFGPHRIGPLINSHLFGNQLAQQFDGEVSLLHPGDLFEKFRIEQRKLLLDVGEEVDYTVALDALFEQLVDPCVDFAQRHFALAFDARQQRAHSFEIGRFETLLVVQQTLTERQRLPQQQRLLDKQLLRLLAFGSLQKIDSSADRFGPFQIGFAEKGRIVEPVQQIETSYNLYLIEN